MSDVRRDEHLEIRFQCWVELEFDECQAGCRGEAIPDILGPNVEHARSM